MKQAEVSSDIPDYDRDDWSHWSDANGDCQDTRQEVLIAESKRAVTFKTPDRCTVKRGRWLGLYTGKVVRNPSALDIDHLVPLGNAHRSGGWVWDSERKRKFANSLKPKDHLIAVTASANRAKGDRGPEEWQPSRRKVWCRYATSWAQVKKKWGLTVTAAEAEADALREMLATCKRKTKLVTKQVEDAPVPPVEEEPAPTNGATYGSCDAAEAAGEMRVQGTKGTGRGFPKAMVPSARDGDGDGVVCEI